MTDQAALEVVALIHGSGDFLTLMQVAEQLQNGKRIILVPPHVWSDGVELAKNQVHLLNGIHEEQIRLSDRVVVCDPMHEGLTGAAENFVRYAQGWEKPVETLGGDPIRKEDSCPKGSST